MTPADRIAHEAARLYETGAVSSIRAAINAAAAALGLEDVRPPTPGRVRQHVQAMSMQALGLEGYEDRVRGVFEAVVELMTVLETALEGAETLLVGRPARGQVDGDGRLHVRLYTDRPVHEIAAALVDHGYDEPEFETADTRRGRFSRVVVTDDAHEFVITRCPPAQRGNAGKDLYTLGPIATHTLAEVTKKATPPTP